MLWWGLFRNTHVVIAGCCSARRMKFILEQVTTQGIRLGRMVVHGTEEIILETPLCVSHTRSGFIPLLTPDIVEQLPHRPPAAMLTMATMFEQPGTHVLNKFGQGIHKFLSSNNTLLYMSVQDPCTPPSSSYNEEKNVSIWNSGGRRKVTVEEYMELVEAFQPDIFEALCDTATSLECKHKRIKKSVDRTLQFLDKSLEIKALNEKLKSCAVLGSIEGSDLMEERIRSARETATRPVDGFVIEGFQLAYSTETLKDIIFATVGLLPDEKPRFIHGLYKPSDIFAALECGIDVFESSYALTATEKGCALTYPNSMSRVVASDDDVTKRENLSTECNNFEINLNDTKYAHCFEPLLACCTCYTCVNYTAAYVHHLLVTKELLAGILLMIHNLSHIYEFFHNLRQSIFSKKYHKFKSLCSNYIELKEKEHE